MGEDFFKEAFKGYEEIPGNLKAASIAICKEFDINGIADPMYIVNVIGQKTGIGNTSIGFKETKVTEKEIRDVAGALKHSFNKVDEDKIFFIIKSTI